MTQDEKELLLRDLCARLSYGVKIRLQGKPRILFGVQENLIVVRARSEDCGWEWNEYDIKEWNIKPYLRPMSSMTDEERDELWHLSEEYFGKAIDKQIEESLSSSNRNESEILEYIASSVIVDWLNVHHFDHRGLIEKDLALEAPEGMYNFK